jgi:ATP-dependent RNA helicase DDX41
MSYKRRAFEGDDGAPVYRLDDEIDEGELYVPVKKRREAKLAQLAGKHSLVVRSTDEDNRRREAEEAADLERQERERERQRKSQQTLLQEAQEVKRRQAEEGASRSQSLTLAPLIAAT